MNILNIVRKVFTPPCEESASNRNSVRCGYDWHQDFVAIMFDLIRPKVYVELGLYQCELFNRAEPFVEEMYGVDINGEAHKYMIDSPKTKFFHGTTLQFSKEARNANLKIDMLFIDADHSKESVLDDFKAYFDLVTVDGIILLHDSYPANEQDALPGYCGDCYKAIEELSKNTEAYEMMTIPVPPGLTLCRKRKKQVAWISS